MSLPGSEVDSQTMKSGLVNMNKGIQVEIVEQASGADIVRAVFLNLEALTYSSQDERVTGLKNSALASCWFYRKLNLSYLPL